MLGCASLKATHTDPGLRLRQFRRVHLEFIDHSQKIPMPWNWPNLIWTRDNSRQLQVAEATSKLAALLSAGGFELVDRSDSPDAVASFEVVSVRLDPITGWIADRAVLSFRSTRSGQELVRFEASGLLVTPTLDRLVDRVAESAVASF